LGARVFFSPSEVAVKSYKREELDWIQRSDLKREIEIQSSIDHPNVARLLAVYESSKHRRLVMEHLTGGDLFEDFAKRGPFKESEAALVIKQVLQAVEHLHRQGIVHRDIKLENLVYESKQRDKVKLIDFGLSARWRPGDRPMTRAVGTLSYLAPEVSEEEYTNKVARG